MVGAGLESLTRKTGTRVCLLHLRQTLITRATTRGGGPQCQQTATLRPCTIISTARGASRLTGLQRRAETARATRRRRPRCPRVFTHLRRPASPLRRQLLTVSLHHIRAVRCRASALVRPSLRLPMVAARRQQMACRHPVPKVRLLARMERARAAL